MLRETLLDWAAVRTELSLARMENTKETGLGTIQDLRFDTKAEKSAR